MTGRVATDGASSPGPKRQGSAMGCIGCRLRRKKCSLEKPVCVNCVRNAILCTWQEPGNKEQAQLLRRTNPTGRRAQHHVASPGSDGGSSYRYTPRANSADSPLDIVTHVPHGGRGSPRESSAQDPTVIEGISLAFHFLDLQIPQGNALLRNTSSRRLFQHYLERTTKAMAICGGKKNPFIAELVPMAMSHQVVLNALLACSGTHLADLNGAPAGEETWLHYGQAIQGLKFGLTDLATGRVEMLVPLLVTAIVLCMVESFKGKSGSAALYHLKAARALIQEGLRLDGSLISPLLSHQAAVFLVERYTYTMVLAHITMGPESDQWVLDDTARLFQVIRAASADTPDALYGCVHELFEFIPRVSVLSRQVNAAIDGGSVASDWQDDYVALVQAISSWKGRSDDDIDNVCGQIYQQALLVYLSSSCTRPGPHEDSGSQATYTADVQRAFDRFIPLLESIPAHSPISTSLCWPLAIFGSCARTPHHRHLIVSTLSDLSRVYSAPSVRDTKFLLEKLWEENNSSMQNPMSFEQLMEREKMTVLFF